MENKIKSAEELLEEWSAGGYTKGSMIEFAKEYAKQMIDAQLEVAAHEAYCDLVHPPTDEYPDLEESEVLVCKDSIRNCRRIELI